MHFSELNLSFCTKEQLELLFGNIYLQGYLDENVNFYLSWNWFWR